VTPVDGAVQRNVVATGAVLLVFAAALSYSPNFRWEDGPRASAFGGDFIHEYLGGHLVRHGDRARFYDPAYARELQHDPAVLGFRFDTDQWSPIIYPPFYYLLLSPLSRLPFATANLLFVGLMAACFALTVALLSWAYPRERTLLTWGVALSVCFPPLITNLVMSQKGTLALLVLTGTWVLLDRRRPFAAGLVFGLLAFKPQLTLVIGLAMLLGRQWAFVRGAALTGAALVGLSVMLGVDVCRQYLVVASTMASYIETPGFPLGMMHCWYGFFRLLLAGLPVAIVQGATLLASLATVCTLARLMRGPLALATPRFALQFAGLVAGTVLLSPHLLVYDLTILLLPFFLLARLVVQASAPLRHRAWLTRLGVLLVPLTSAPSMLPFATRVQASVPLLLAILIVLARQPVAMMPGTPVALRSRALPFR
jgi:hypothetical protein